MMKEEWYKMTDEELLELRKDYATQNEKAWEDYNHNLGRTSADVLEMIMSDIDWTGRNVALVGHYTEKAEL